MLLNGAIKNDSRVIRMIRTLASKFQVDLYYINGSPGDDLIFKNLSVRLFDTSENLRKSWVNRNLFLHLEFLHFIEVVNRSGIDYKYIHANDYPTLYPAIKLGKKLNAKVVYDSHEIYLETINQFFSANNVIKGYLVKLWIALVKGLGFPIEYRLMKQLSVFITTSPSFLNYFKAKYKLPKKSLIVMNCPNKEPVEKAKEQNHFGVDGTVVLYQGMLNPGRGLNELVLSAHFLPEGIYIVILGDGPLKNHLKDTVSKKGLEEKVIFIDAVPSSVLSDYTRAADIGVLILEPYNLSKKLASANKIFEYMAAGIPIIATDLPENRRVIEDCDAGILISDHSPESISSAVRYLSENPKKMQEFGSNGRLGHIIKYNFENQEHKLFRNLLSKD